MALSIKLGSYSFGSNVDTFEIEQESRINPITVPRRDGYVTDEAYKSGMRIRIGGTISEADDTTARATLSSLKNAFSLGKQMLTLYDDRQAEVQQSYFRYGYQNGDLRIIEWEAELIADDYGFSAVNQTVDENTIASSPQTDVFVNNGNLETYPVVRITAVGGNISAGVRIDNLTTGKYFIYNAQIDSGDWIEIDCDQLTVVDQDGVNKFASFDGDFFKLAAGNNSIKWTGSAGSHTLKMTYRDKYDGA